MDFFAHILWTLAIFKRYPWSLEAVFFGILPDLIFGIPAVLMMGMRLQRDWQKNYSQSFAKIEPYYRWGHSLVTMSIVFAAISLFLRTPYYPVLAGWGLHILLDAPFHKGGWVQGQAVLYPISHRRINGRWWWKEIVESKPWLAAINYILALAVYFFA